MKDCPEVLELRRTLPNWYSVTKIPILLWWEFQQLRNKLVHIARVNSFGLNGFNKEKTQKWFPFLPYSTSHCLHRWSRNFIHIQLTKVLKNEGCWGTVYVSKSFKNISSVQSVSPVFGHPWNEQVQSGQGPQNGTKKTTVVSGGSLATNRVSLNESLSQGVPAFSSANWRLKSYCVCLLRLLQGSNAVMYVKVLYRHQNKPSLFKASACLARWAYKN